MMNHTVMTLIPKKPKPSSMNDFRPITLCNVVDKLVTKVISNRLKSFLVSIIFDILLAFTPGRLITDNIIVAFELFHAIKGDCSSGGATAIKLDMAKAYDRVGLPFLVQVMLRLGFQDHWARPVMRCVRSASFSFLVNGTRRGHVAPSCGLH